MTMISYGFNKRRKPGIGVSRAAGKYHQEECTPSRRGLKFKVKCREVDGDIVFCDRGSYYAMGYYIAFFVWLTVGTIWLLFYFDSNRLNLNEQGVSMLWLTIVLYLLALPCGFIALLKITSCTQIVFKPKEHKAVIIYKKPRMNLRAVVRFDELSIERVELDFWGSNDDIRRNGIVVYCKGYGEMILCSQKFNYQVDDYVESLPPSIASMVQPSRGMTQVVKW